jgi:hypothetical protein
MHRIWSASPGWECQRRHCKRCTVPQCAATRAPCRMTAGPSGRPQHHAIVLSSTNTYAIPQRRITVGHVGTSGKMAACRIAASVTQRSRDHFAWLQTGASTRGSSQSLLQRTFVALMRAMWAVQTWNACLNALDLQYNSHVRAVRGDADCTVLLRNPQWIGNFRSSDCSLQGSSTMRMP